MHVLINYATKNLTLAKMISEDKIIPDLEYDEIPCADYVDSYTQDIDVDERSWLCSYFDIEDTQMDGVKKITASGEKKEAIIKEYSAALKVMADLCEKYGYLNIYDVYLFCNVNMDDVKICSTAIDTINAVEGRCGEPCLCIADASMYERCCCGFKAISERFPIGESFYVVSNKGGSYHW